MKPITGVACIAAICGNFSFANAAETQVWVSKTGKNTGECLKTGPCATLQYAYERVPANGTINIEDSGSYGPIVIAKPLSIIAPDGVDALIGVAPNSVGVDVQTTGHVLLKGLHIAGTEMDNNIAINSNSGRVIIDHVTAANVQTGVSARNGFMLIRNSLLVGNGTGLACAFIADANGYGGISVNYQCIVYMGQTTITDNANGIAGMVYSYGDNDMNGNTACDICGDSVLLETPHDQ